MTSIKQKQVLETCCSFSQNRNILRYTRRVRPYTQAKGLPVYVAVFLPYVCEFIIFCRYPGHNYNASVSHLHVISSRVLIKTTCSDNRHTRESDIVIFSLTGLEMNFKNIGITITYNFNRNCAVVFNCSSVVVLSRNTQNS